MVELNLVRSQKMMSKNFECSNDFRDYLKMIKLAKSNRSLTNALLSSVLILSVEPGCGCKSMLNEIHSALFDAPKGIKIFSSSLPPGLRVDDPSAKSVLDLTPLSNSEYGILCIDVSGCSASDQTFVNLMNKIANKIGKTNFLFALRIHHDDSNIIDFISSKMQNFCIDIPVCDSYIFTAAVSDILNDCNAEIDSNAYDAINEIVAMYMIKPNFHGFKSISRIALDILAFVSEHSHSTRITESLLLEYRKTLSDSSGGSALQEIRNMVGMDKIADQVEEIITFCREAKSHNMPVPKLHMVLEGPAGCGKSTVARLIGKAFNQAGFLRNSSFTELHGRDFAAPYMGQTAEKTNAILSSIHGVAFIDEFYAICLDSEGKDEYGSEAINTLIKAMEDRPNDDIVIIAAGYKSEIDKVLAANEGLKSRIPWSINITPYTREQLRDIFLQHIDSSYEWSPDFFPAVNSYFDNLSESVIHSREFGQGRFCRNLVEKVCIKSATRRSQCNEHRLLIDSNDFNAAVDSLQQDIDEKTQIGFAV